MSYFESPSRLASAIAHPRRLALLCDLLVAGLLCLASPAMAAAPDLTAGGVPTDSEQWNLGPTGMTGWCYREGNSSANARQFQVKTVSLAVGSPAAGIMAVNDVILGASGTGADPVNMTNDARVAFAQAIGEAEAQSPATLKILRWRSGVTSIVSLPLQTMGAYSATAPYNCPKSAAILEKGLQYMMTANANDGNWRYSALTLLAGNDPANTNNAARQAKATNELRQLILPPATIALYTSGKSMSDGNIAKPWHIGPKLIALAEYYLQTGDADVLPSIRAYAHCAANGQSMFGTCGHYFTNPGFRNTPVNGPYNVGYGPINNAAIPCYIGLVLAKKCGLNDPEILAGVQRARTFYAQYTHNGCAGYGEHGPYMGHDTNGKSGLQALAFALEGDMPVETKYYARASTAAAIAERDIGHTGSYFAFLYTPLGANVGGPDAIAYYFRETRWMYELARRWDGSFVYNTWSGGGVEVDALSGPAGALMATPMLLTYAMPLRQTYLTGKNQDTNNWITPAEMPAVSAASAHIYNPATRTTPELLQDITSWSPKQRLNAAREIDKRTAEYATLLPTLHAMATNEAASFTSRAGACQTIGLIGDSNSVPVLVPLVTDTNFVVRFHASSAIASMSGLALKPHVVALMQACIANQRPLLPLDPQDPMQTVNGNLCSALFAPYAALHYHDLVGLDRELLYGAMRVCAANAQAGVRGTLYTVYPKLNAADIEQVGDVFVNIAYENAPAGMGVTGSRLPSISFLQSKGKAEGVPLAIRFAEDLGYNNGGIVNPLNVLEDYAASSRSVQPDPKVEQFSKILIASGAKYGIPEAQAVLAAIGADTSPETLTPFKGIDWIIPDDPMFNLPRRWTTLRVHAHNTSNTNSVYTWRKMRGAGAVSFTPNGTGAAKDTTVIFDGIPGQYLFEATLSDSHGLTEVSETVTVTLRTAGGTLPPNLPPTANGQALAATQGTPTQIILTGADPEGYALTYTVTNGPAHGTLSGTAPNLVYTPAANYTGADSLTFTVEDSEGQVASATVNFTVSAAGAIGLAIYEPFNYAATNLNGRSGASEIGLTGTWTAGSQITTEASSLTYGTVPTNGIRIKSVAINSPGGSRPISTNALAARGLLDNGATVWFSVVLGGYGGYILGGNSIDLALANTNFPYGPNIPNDGIQPGSGLGVRLANTGVYAAQYYATNAPLTGAYDNTVTGGIINDQPRLVVGKITWGATNDIIEIYLPEPDLVLSAKPTSTLTANVDQATFDTLTFSRGANVLLDEIRFGATLQSVLQGTVAMTSDVTAPIPNPMTFAVAPTPASSSSITMTATPALDGLGVEYFFACTNGGGNSSGWQTSNTYTDTNLTPGVAYTYTVKARDQHPALNETAVSAAASATIPALGTVPGVVGLPQALAQTQITNATLAVGTVTPAGSYSLTVPAGCVLSQSPAADTAVAYGSAVDLVLSIGQDPALPVLTPVNIVDDRGGETVEIGTPVTFTLTFSKDIDAATLDAGDFINAGDVPITLGAFAEISPGVVTVTVTPGGLVAGNLRFAVAAGALIEDTLGNDLNTTSAIIDDTVITVTPVQPKTQTFTGNNSNGTTDNWNNYFNWNVNTGPVPSTNNNVVIPANKQVTSNSTNTPTFTGNLTLGAGAHLQAGYNANTINSYNCLGTPGTTTISMAEGARISFRENLSPIVPAIVLQGDSDIDFGISGSGVPAGTDPIFNYPITGPYQLTFSGKSDCSANLNVANNFGHILLSSQNGTLFTVNANAAGALGGDVTVQADPSAGTKGANLIFAAANAMADTATLSLYGNTGSLVTVNANDTIAGLKLNGVNQLPGIYTSNSASWLAGSGTLTVTGPATAYWNPPGGPTGTWDDSDIWNPLANLTGTNNAWSAGLIAAFNAAGTYSVTLTNIKEIAGLMVSNGAVTLADGELSLSTEAPISIASGASLAINTLISQNDIGLGLHKSGAGTLTLSSENIFTGPVAIGAGILSVATIDNAGAPSALGQYPDAGISGLILGGGTLRYTGGNANVNRGFTFTSSSTIDINNPGSSLTLGDVETAGTGTLTAIGGAGSSLGLGHIKMVQNNLTLNPTIATMTVASVEGYSSNPTKPNLTLSGSSTGNVVTGGIFVTAYPGDTSTAGIGVVKTGTSDWKIAGVLSSAGGAFAPRVSVTVSQGTLILAGSNTYGGETRLNNGAKLVLDFAATDTSKIPNTGTLKLAGGTLEMKGGTHIEEVGSGNATTSIELGPTTFITRDGGTARLRMDTLTRSAGGTISFLDGTVADTDSANTNGILGGYATIGADWAVSAASASNTPITALATYDTWTASGGSATANYLLSGSDTLGAALAANSLKIANTANSQTLNLGTNNLTITTTSASALGGILYAGGNDNKYTISGTGGLLASTTTGEFIIHTYAGTLTVNTPVVTTGATAGLLTKSGKGTLILGGTNVYTGTTRVASGKLFVNGSLTNQSVSLIVEPGATLGGSGTVGRNISIANGGKLEFNLSTAAASHVPLTRTSGRSFAFSGSSTLTITSSGGAAPGLYTLMTGGANITGVAPTNIIFPPGCVATVSIATNSLLLNVTAISPLPAYTVIYDGNGNSSGSVPAESGSAYLSNSVVTVSGNTGGLARPGYDFTGWNTLADDSGTAYAPSNSFAIAENLVLYAQWTGNTHVVSYDGNGHDSGAPPANQTKTNNMNLTLATNSNNLVKTGYFLFGWNTAADGNGTDYTLAGTYTSNAPLVLYAKWAFGNNGTWIQTAAGPFNWSDATNWSGGVVANGPGTTAFFTPNFVANQVVNLDSPRTNGNLTFTDSTTSSHDLTISGANPLTLSRISGAPVIDVTQSGRTLTIASEIAGNNGLQKNGAGNLTLSGTNTFTGGLVLNAGALRMTNAQSFTGGITLNGGSFGDTTIKLNAAALNGNPITVNGSATMSVASSAATITGGILINSSGSLKLASDASTAFVNGVLSGTGMLDVGAVGGSGSSITLSNTANTFTGGVVYSANNNGGFALNVVSFADSASPGAGKIVMGNGGATSIQTFTLHAGAIAPLAFTNRQFELTNSFTSQTLKIANNSTQAFNIHSDLLASGTGSKTLTLGGTGAGVSTFAGTIANGNITNLAVTKTDSGTWVLSGNNTYSGVTTVSAGTLSLSSIDVVANANPLGKSAAPATNLLLGNGTTLRYTGGAASCDRSFNINGTANNHSATLDASGTGALNLTSTASPAYGTTAQPRTLILSGTNANDNTLAANIADNGGSAVSITKDGIGKWVLTGTSTATGVTKIQGGGTAGTVVLDFANGTAPNTARLPSGALTLQSGGGNLVLRGGSYTQSVASLAIGANALSGGHTAITREGGSSMIAFNAIHRNQSYYVTMSLAEDGLATTTSAPVNGILSGGITVGSHWAKTNGSGAIVALTAGDYTALPSGTSTGTVNYQLTGSTNRTTATTLNSLRIVSDDNDQVLNLGTFNLNPSPLSDAGSTPGRYTGNCAAGGLLYAGGGNNNYTITGTGASSIGAQNGNQEVIINTYTGTLNVEVPLTMGIQGLAKSGAGTLVLTKTNTYTGPTHVNQGTLLVKGSPAVSAVTVHPNATFGGSGTVGGVVRYQNGSLAQFTVGSYMTFTNAAFMTNVTVKVDLGSNLGNGTYVLATNHVGFTTSGSLTFAPNSGSLGAGGSGVVSVAGNNLILTVSGVGGGGSSTNAFLNSLVLTPPGTLSPSFASNVFTYTATNAFGVSPTVTVVNADLTATNQLIYSGATNGLASGSPSSGLSLTLGVVNPVVVRVTAQDNVTVQTYVVNVTMQPSLTSPTLGRTVSGTTLSLSWPSSHLGYTLQVKTNPANAGLNGGTWTPVAGSSSVTSTNLPISTTTPTTFYRLVYP